MKLLSIPILMAALLVPQLGYAQNHSRISNRPTARVEASAEKAWPSFFAAFRAAVKNRDRAALREMMVPGFLYSLGGGADCCDGDSRDEAFKFWDADNGRGWKAFNRTLAQGAVPQARWWNNGNHPERPSRVAPAAANRRVNIDRGRIGWYAIFEFHEDGRWYCDIFQECCD